MVQKVFQGVVDAQSDPRILFWLVEECRDGMVVFQYQAKYSRTEMKGSERDIKALSEKLKEWGYQEA